VDAGWWSQTAGGYVIRHHGQYQRSREDVLKQQAANVANGRRGGRPGKQGREQANDLETKSLNESPTERDGTGREGRAVMGEQPNTAELTEEGEQWWPTEAATW
jgi:hypothetical protein